MCHPEVPEGAVLPDVRTAEVAVPVEGGAPMPALLALPERTPAPGVLVINDVFGRSPFYEHLTRRIAQAGFVALDVEFFFREGRLPTGSREESQARAAKLDLTRTERDLSGGLDFLAARGEVRGARRGLVGFCMGGTLALLLASRRDDLATVSYYGFPARGPLEVAERIHPPLLGHWGIEDASTGIDNVRALDAKLNAARIAHTFHEYPGLGHGFLKAFLDEEGTPDHAQACDSWKRTLDFWRASL